MDDFKDLTTCVQSAEAWRWRRAWSSVPSNLALQINSMNVLFLDSQSLQKVITTSLEHLTCLLMQVLQGHKAQSISSIPRPIHWGHNWLCSSQTRHLEVHIVSASPSKMPSDVKNMVLTFVYCLLWVESNRIFFSFGVLSSCHLHT